MPCADKDNSMTVMLFTWVSPGGQNLLPLIRSKNILLQPSFISIKTETNSS